MGAQIIRFADHAPYHHPFRSAARRFLNWRAERYPAVAIAATPQERVNALAARGYWWGVQDVAAYIPVAFIAGMCAAFVMVH